MVVKEAEVAIGEVITGVEEGRGGGRYSENEQRFQNAMCVARKVIFGPIVKKP